MLLQEDKHIPCTTVPLFLNPFSFQDSSEIFLSHVIAVSTYRGLRKRQMLQSLQTMSSKVPHCQDSSFLTYLGLALTCLRGVLGGVSSLVNMEDKAGTQNTWQADCQRQSLRFSLESEGRNKCFQGATLLVPRYMSTSAHMNPVFLAPLVLKSKWGE